jgi:ABC-type multidrug transport system fused ATPase/permease subunit
MSAAPSTLRRVGTSFWPYRRRLLLLAAVTVVIAELNVAGLLLIKPIFDRALFCKVGCPNLALLGWLVAAMLTVTAMGALLGYWQPYLATVLGQRVMRDLRDALYAHLQRMPVRFFTETKNGEIQSRFANDVGGVQRVVTESTSLMLMYAVTFLSTVVAMAMLSWQLTALAVSCAPPFCPGTPPRGWGAPPRCSSGSPAGPGTPAAGWLPRPSAPWPSCPRTRSRHSRYPVRCCPERSAANPASWPDSGQPALDSPNWRSTSG